MDGQVESIPSLKAAPLPHESCILDTQEVTVNQLIYNNTMTWDFQALYSLFSPLVVAAVLKISLSKAFHDDKLIWREEKNGKFSVHSTYYLIQFHRGNPPILAHYHDYDQLWKQL